MKDIETLRSVIRGYVLRAAEGSRETYAAIRHQNNIIRECYNIPAVFYK